MVWRWSDFDKYDTVLTVTVSLTEKEIALILSALSVMESIESWDNYEGNGDDIDAALGEIGGVLVV